MGTGICEGNVLTQDITYDISSVPEPSSLLIMLSGVVGIGVSGTACGGLRSKLVIAAFHRAMGIPIGGVIGTAAAPTLSS